MTKTPTPAADFLAHIDSFEDADFEQAQFRKASPKPKQSWPCTQCGGTGRWASYSGSYSGECFACKGEGKFTTSPEFRAKRKDAFKKGLETKRQNQMARQQAFEEANPGLINFLNRAADWSGFALQLVNIWMEGGVPSDKQTAAANSMRAKVETRRAEKQAAKVTEVDLAQIERMFDKARESGLKKLVYRAHGLQISPAPAHGKNPGAIYIKEVRGDYLGKVIGGKLFAASACTPEHKATLNKVAADPAAEARAYGKETGTCCCCGRELTDPVSIANGIGPICAAGWGF
jgi:hypothetical protein